MFGFQDQPGQYLLYSTSKDIRSLTVVDEFGGFERIGFYENLAQQYGGICDSDIVTLESRSDFVRIARTAIIEGARDPNHPNTKHLLSVVDQLS
ncbi:hypothetical protein HY025_00890 [Candidatus Daviesbacteria bacterium]|nr:hypothetical protein [Candidatus Daviesbacteria bacterium]